MSELERDKQAIRTVLERHGEATMPAILLRTGDGILDAFVEMMREGEIETCHKHLEERLRYRLVPAKETPPTGET